MRKYITLYVIATSVLSVFLSLLYSQVKYFLWGPLSLFKLKEDPSMAPRMELILMLIWLVCCRSKGKYVFGMLDAANIMENGCKD